MYNVPSFFATQTWSGLQFSITVLIVATIQININLMFVNKKIPKQFFSAELIQIFHFVIRNLLNGHQRLSGGFLDGCQVLRWIDIFGDSC
jgi:hypothetical protein